jgi:hypothetical protein
LLHIGLHLLPLAKHGLPPPPPSHAPRPRYLRVSPRVAAPLHHIIVLQVYRLRGYVPSPLCIAWRQHRAIGAAQPADQVPPFPLSRQPMCCCRLAHPQSVLAACTADIQPAGTRGGRLDATTTTELARVAQLSHEGARGPRPKARAVAMGVLSPVGHRHLRPLLLHAVAVVSAARLHGPGTGPGAV